jgi:alcohol dehydrogenase class IV
VPEAVLDSVAAEAATNATVHNNPKPVTETDLRELLRRAW